MSMYFHEIRGLARNGPPQWGVQDRPDSRWANLVRPSQYAKTPAHPFVVANAFKKASYVSLQSALAHHGMILEFVPVTTSVAVARPEDLSTPIGRFQFRHVRASLFLGFGEIEIARDQAALLASPEKALVDLLYLTPHGDRVEYLREIRLERNSGFEQGDLRTAVKRSRSAKIERAVERLLDLWRNRGPRCPPS